MKDRSKVRDADVAGLKYRGQALVEFVLVLPIMLLMVLATVESGMLVAQKGTQDRSTATLASWAVYHPSEVPGPSWDVVTASELPGCTITIDTAEEGVIRIGSTCQWSPIVLHGVWDGLPISSSETAATAPTTTEAVR